ncbi:MAG: hypothetical protein WC244_04015 [Patescibacteria group bacterium]|jgi:hypothetical protein
MSEVTNIPNKSLDSLILRLKDIQDDFFKHFGVTDIISNSKIFEIVIANDLGHILIPGHSGSRDAKNENGGEFEYKHYKESSSNHTWTFNDFTDTTIVKLASIESVIFAHIDDSDLFPKFDWYYNVPGKLISKYLEEKTKAIKNHRKMINVGSKQIEENFHLQKTFNSYDCKCGNYYNWLNEICNIAKKIEEITGTKEVLTSNKFWEILVALILNHRALSEQLGHDAVDDQGRFYEYKVSKSNSWNFQDISDKVLDKYKNDYKIILAVVDKDEFKIKKIYEVNSLLTIKKLKKKLSDKKAKYKQMGKVLRRLQISLSMGDLKELKTKQIYPL